MVTQKGKNTAVVAIHGNFDEAQSGVKRMFEDPKLREELREAGFRFSSANSINIGRLVPQIVYYVYAYGGLLKNGEIQEGDPVNVVVPTGNFGNILAACYAKQMGIPIHKLICASNENKVLFDFFRTGTYDEKPRNFCLQPLLLWIFLCPVIWSVSFIRFLIVTVKRRRADGAFEAEREIYYHSGDERPFAGFWCRLCIRAGNGRYDPEDL